ncbi:MAG: hypothetical protein QOG10_360, partial [Kribbellaceae bacterium]|nr:hypothetical protein [Kribbellaceae bacterium]
MGDVQGGLVVDGDAGIEHAVADAGAVDRQDVVPDSAHVDPGSLDRLDDGEVPPQLG